MESRPRADELRAVQGWWRSAYTEASSVSQGVRQKLSMIRKSGNQISEKMMFKQRDEIMVPLNLIGS